MKKLTSFLVMAIVVGLSVVLISCTRGDKLVETPESQPVDTVPGAAAGGQQQLQGAVPTPSQIGAASGVGVGNVAGGGVHGRADFSKVFSELPCVKDADCTFSKFANVPKNVDGCTCQAPCEPYVVNVRERDAREASNKRLCSNTEWFGPKCSVPPCNFIEYDRFECREGKCLGTDLNGL